VGGGKTSIKLVDEKTAGCFRASSKRGGFRGGREGGELKMLVGKSQKRMNFVRELGKPTVENKKKKKWGKNTGGRPRKKV